MACDGMGALMRYLVIVVLALWPSLAQADFLGCYERPAAGSMTVYGKAHFLDSGGDSVAATSKEAKVIRAGQTATFATVADGTFSQVTDRVGWYWVPIAIASTDTLGTYGVSYRGTFESNQRDGGDDEFQVVALGQCGTYLDASLATKIPTALSFTGANVNANVQAMAAGVVTSTVVADGTLRATSEIAVTKCDVSASTSGTSFTIATCTSPAGETITLADGSFAGRMMEAYTNGGAQCNVVGERVFVQTVVAGVVTVRTSTVTGGQGGFSVTPSATNCGIYF